MNGGLASGGGVVWLWMKRLLLFARNEITWSGSRQARNHCQNADLLIDNWFGNEIQTENSIKRLSSLPRMLWDELRNSNIPLRSMIYAGNKSRLTLRALQQGEDKLYLDKRFSQIRANEGRKKGEEKVKNILALRSRGRIKSIADISGNFFLGCFLKWQIYRWFDSTHWASSTHCGNSSVKFRNNHYQALSLFSLVKTPTSQANWLNEFRSEDRWMPKCLVWDYCYIQLFLIFRSSTQL